MGWVRLGWCTFCCIGWRIVQIFEDFFVQRMTMSIEYVLFSFRLQSTFLYKRDAYTSGLLRQFPCKRGGSEQTLSILWFFNLTVAVILFVIVGRWSLGDLEHAICMYVHVQQLLTNHDTRYCYSANCHDAHIWSRNAYF